MYGVSSSKDPRSGIQNGFWGIKVLIYVGAIVGAFFIPSGTFTEGKLEYFEASLFIWILDQVPRNLETGTSTTLAVIFPPCKPII